MINFTYSYATCRLGDSKREWCLVQKLVRLEVLCTSPTAKAYLAVNAVQVISGSIDHNVFLLFFSANSSV